jgi:hypothetical protein
MEAVERVAHRAGRFIGAGYAVETWTVDPDENHVEPGSPIAASWWHKREAERESVELGGRVRSAMWDENNHAMFPHEAITKRIRAARRRTYTSPQNLGAFVVIN